VLEVKEISCKLFIYVFLQLQHLYLDQMIEKKVP